MSSSEKHHSLNVSEGPVGIGGWMIIPIIGFIGVALLTIINLLNTFSKDGIDALVVIFNATSGPVAALKMPMLLSRL